MNQQEIQQILPHRKPMLLVDDAEVNPDGSATGHYQVRGDEFFLQGHFPGNPVVPGVMLCEMMAQTCAVMLQDKVKGATPYFTSLDKVKFKQVVRPGDRIEFQVALTRSRPPFYFAEGKGYVEGKLCVTGEFSFALMAPKD